MAAPANVTRKPLKTQTLEDIEFQEVVEIVERVHSYGASVNPKPPWQRDQLREKNKSRVIPES